MKRRNIIRAFPACFFVMFLLACIIANKRVVKIIYTNYKNNNVEYAVDNAEEIAAKAAQEAMAAQAATTQPQAGPAVPPPMPGAAPVPPPIVPQSEIKLFIAVAGQQYGPYNMDMCKQMVQGGQLTPQSMVWMEGMPLYRAGTLRFPDTCMVILSDFGPDQMWGREYDETPRLPGTAYGIYYHVCFWGCGPHLAQGNRPEKIMHNYAQARKMGDTAYSILNVSNIREHLLGISTAAKATWHLEGASAQEAEKS